MRIQALILSVIISWQLPAFATATTGGGTTSTVRLEDAVQAIINYMAFVKENEWAADREAMLDSAPSTLTALDHGSAIGALNDGVKSRIEDNLRSDMNRFLNPGAKITKGSLYTSHQQRFGSNREDLNIARILGRSKIESEEDIEAAKQAIYNITVPAPDPADPTKPFEAANDLIFNANAGVGLNSLYNALSMRQHDETLGTSMMEMIEDEATFRFLDPENVWRPAIAASTQEGLTRELLMIKSFEAFQSHLKYKQGERLEALLASQNYMLTEMTKVVGELGSLISQMNNQLQGTTEALGEMTDEVTNSINNADFDQ